MRMPFKRPLSIDSPLSTSETRARVRTFAISRDLPELEAFRRRQLIGWRLSQSHEDCLFQPEYGDTLDVEGSRFVALVEPGTPGGGSRIRGRVVASPLMKIVMSVWMLAVVVAAVVALAEGRQPAGRVLGIALVMLVGAVLMVRYSLRTTARHVESRLRHALEASARAAA